VRPGDVVLGQEAAARHGKLDATGETAMTRKVSPRSRTARAGKTILLKQKAKKAREIRRRRAHQEERFAKDPLHRPAREYLNDA
jgi:hypothetical protein